MRNGKPGSLRVVLDTNVLISAYQFSGRSVAGIRKALEDGKFILVFSPALASELGEILRRFQWSDEEARGLIRFLAKKSILVDPKTIPDAVPTDPDDNHIVACAIEAKADLIVSGDRDLLSLREYAGIPIVRPVDFLRTIG